jgi:hypothetical protein
MPCPEMGLCVHRPRSGFHGSEGVFVKLYKLTDKDGYTRRGESNETLWGENVTHEAKKEGTALCTGQVIHAYESLEMAAFMHPAHAILKDPVAWEFEGEVVAREKQVNCGVKKGTTVGRVALPEITTEQRVEIAIRCAVAFYTEPTFKKWADAWLDGSDRSDAAARAAAWAAAWAASRAARAAARAAEAAAWAAARAAEAAAWAARAADRAAAGAAAGAEADVDVLAIIKTVLAKGAK